MGEYHGLREFWTKAIVVIALYLVMKLGFANEVWIMNLWRCFGIMIVLYLLGTLFEFNADQARNKLTKTLCMLLYILCEAIKVMVIYIVMVNLRYVISIEGNNYWLGPYGVLGFLLVGQITVCLAGVISNIKNKE